MNINETFYCSKCLRELEDEGICPFCGYDEDEVVYDPQVLEEGTLLHDKRYRIGALIGRGGFGMTYAAWDQTLLSAVAIKEYFPEGFASREVEESNEVQVADDDRLVFGVGLSNFMREAHILAALQNVEHVVKVSNCFEENGTAYIVMEYVHGVTLEEYVKAHQIGTEELIKMLRKPIDALALIHGQGVMHRDITPKNLMVQEDGTIKLIDFGAAHVDESKIRGRNYSISATMHYAAPEQYDPKMQQGQWTDVYGLSATMYALLTGCQPPDSQERMKRDTLVPPSKMGKGVSKRQEKAIMEGLRVNPENRLRSVEEFRSILYNLPTPEIVRQRRKIMRRMTAIMTAAAALTLLLIVNFALGFPLGEGLMYSLRSDGWHVMSLLGEREMLSVPGSRMTLPVSQIGEKAFAGNERLRMVTLPESIQKIGSQAFYGAKALETVKIAEGTQTIGSLAFAQCAALHTVYVPSTLEEIGEATFLNTPEYLTCWGVRDSEGLEAVRQLGLNTAVRSDYEIAACEGGAMLTAYHGGAGDLVLPSVIDGLRVVQFDEETAYGLLPASTTSVVLPYYLARIPENAFINVIMLESVQMGPHVESIGSNAFCLAQITQIELPESLRRIENNAFTASALRAIEIPKGVEVIGEEAFLGANLEHVVVYGDHTQIGAAAFVDNENLTQVTLPRTMQLEVLTDSFALNRSLKNIVLPDSLREVQMGAFMDCIQLEAIELPERVESIHYGAFASCTNLRYVGIPSSVTMIDDCAFLGCTTDLIIAGYPDTEAQRFAQKNGFVFEDKSRWTAEMIVEGRIDTEEAEGDIVCPTFDQQTNALIRNVSLVSSLGRSVDDHGSLGAVRGNKLESVVLPRFTETIDEYAFFAEASLRSVTLPQSLRYISASAFWNCTALEKADLPEGLLTIGTYAFAGCNMLETVNLPASLNLIGQCAFSGCTGITRIELPKKIAVLEEWAFSGTSISEVLIPGNVKICGAAFEDCRLLKTAEIKSGVREMYGTFAGCTALETVSIPASVKHMDVRVFEGCKALKDVYFDDGMEYFFYVYEGESHKFTTEGFSRESAAQRSGAVSLFADCPDVTIHAPANSVMQDYAEVFGLKFEATN